MRNHKRESFTLVELLITIAIIAILAAMLLPALNSAREKAYAISCIGNQKQIMIAFLQYADSNKGWIAGAIPNRDYPASYAAYFVGDRMHAPGAVNLLKEASVHCPADKLKVNENSSEKNYAYGVYGIYTPSLSVKSGDDPSSTKELGGYYYFGTGGKFVGYNTIQMKAPTRTLILSDTYSTQYANRRGGYYRFVKNPGPNSGFAAVLRHVGRCNTGFADGHVASQSASSLTGGIYNLMIFWNAEATSYEDAHN